MQETMQWGTVQDCSVLKPVSSVQDGSLDYTLFESYFHISENKTSINLFFRMDHRVPLVQGGYSHQ